VKGLFLIVRKSLRQHALSTAVTAVSLALASGLVVAVFAIDAQSRAAFTGGAGGYDAVLGARGSELQLVLNAVFHLETSPGNVPWSLVEEVSNDKRVKRAVPYALGDSYRGERIVGTTLERFEDIPGAPPFRVRAPGRLFDPALREAVVGSVAARRTGLRYGSHFNPTHGTSAKGQHEHEEEYVVVGVLEPTGTPVDRVIWIPLEGVFRMGGHYLRGAGEEYEAHPDEDIPDEHKEVSAVLLKLASPMMADSLYREINRQDTRATLAWPVARVMAELFDKLGWMHRVLTLVAYLVVVVATGSIVASLYNTMNERRREFAILRSLGARRRTVFSAIVLESAAIAALGSLLGFVVYAAILYAAAFLVRRETGVVLDVWKLHPAMLATPLGLVVLGALAGVIPAVKAYRTDVASHLVPSS
jgi:putative ABC transport system permease protein